MPLAHSSRLTRYTRNSAIYPAMTRPQAVLFNLFAAAIALPSAIAQTPPGFAGSETCNVCHEDIYNGFAKSPHHVVEVDAKRGWQGRACESCHGPGQAHTEGPSPDNIRDPAKLTAAAADQICLACHLNQPTQVGRPESSHAKNQISCTTCHKVHGSEPLVVRKAEATNKLCGSCHLNVWAQFQRPFHHKLPEGAMSSRASRPMSRVASHAMATSTDRSRSNMLRCALKAARRVTSRMARRIPRC